MIISPVTGTVADHVLLHRIKAGEIGGVILFGENIDTHPQVRALVASLQHAAHAGGRPGLLVMTDQEGGSVRRFQTLPPTSSAQQMGQTSTTAIAHQGQATATGLLADGVNVDLAPVADVPVSADTFLGTRAFSRSSAAVTRDACAFSQGLHDGGAASTLKHFPGLGRASGNTDDGSVTIDAGAAQLAPDLSPYRACANRQRTLVMVSNAIYTGLTGTRPAVLSPAAYALLRSTLHFDGPVISDSLGAAAVAGRAGLPVSAAVAGVDLELWDTQSRAISAYRQLRDAARSGRLPAARVADALGRIAVLKTALGLR
jgi:beta-N-acetylhexosaminidase